MGGVGEWVVSGVGLLAIGVFLLGSTEWEVSSATVYIYIHLKK